METAQTSTSQPMSLPSTQFSFTPPDPPTSKHSRRVSLPNSPRLSTTCTFRDDTSLDPSGKVDSSPTIAFGKVKAQSKSDKKTPRKKWSEEETQMLVYGCEKHGVGNWKLMVEDPELKFDSRSAMDLKDRFRTYFNDSYRQLYPNAKTHLSTVPKPVPKVDTNALLFDKSRSRKRRPFTAEEDAVLKAGYENHGPAWATIVTHPVFKAQNRRSTDLRDRFRNAFPDLYTQAGYRPRAAPKAKPAKRRKGSDGDLPAPSRLARGRRATTSILPDTRNAVSDGELSDDEIQVIEPMRPLTQEPRRAESAPEPPVTPSRSLPAELSQPPEPEPQAQTQVQVQTPQPPPTSESSATPIPDISSPPPSTPVESEEHVSSQPSPIPSWPAQDFTSPSLSLPTDYFPPTYRTLNMIPKSAWGPQDWLSSNPRMEAYPHHPTFPQSASSGPSSSFSPLNSSSYSHSQAVFDRYDLLPPGHLTSNFDFSQSEVGEHPGAHSAFSDADLFLGNGFRGFTHHSNTAGDLIFGTRSQGSGSNVHGNLYDRFQLGGTGAVNPMQLHAIDERVESIRLSDQNIAQPSCLPAPSNIQSSLAGSIPLTDMHTMPSLNIPPTESSNQPFAITTDHHQLFVPDHDAVITPTFSQPVTQPPTTSTSPISSQAYPISPRSMSLQSHNRLPFSSSFPQSSHSHDPISQSTNPDTWNMSDPFTFLHSNQLGGFGEDIPFLDLHYWGSPTSHPPNEMGTSIFSVDHTTGALDLAQSPVQRNHPRNSGSFSRSAQRPELGMSQAGTQQQKVQRPGLNHQRVQSATMSFNFQPPYSNDNKRKRVSWDGGH